MVQMELLEQAVQVGLMESQERTVALVLLENLVQMELQVLQVLMELMVQMELAVQAV